MFEDKRTSVANEEDKYWFPDIAISGTIEARISRCVFQMNIGRFQSPKVTVFAATDQHRPMISGRFPLFMKRIATNLSSRSNLGQYSDLERGLRGDVRWLLRLFHNHLPWIGERRKR